MDFTWIVPLLSLITLGAVALLAAAGKLARTRSAAARMGVFIVFAFVAFLDRS